MIQLAYFFLLRPGEYTGTNYPTTSFQLKYVFLICGTANFDTLQTPAAAIKTATYGKLDFTTHKNDVRGEVMRHGTSGDAQMRPKSALIRRVLYFREHGAPPFQNLTNFKRGSCWVNITPNDIRKALYSLSDFLVSSWASCPKMCPRDLHMRQKT